MLLYDHGEPLQIVREQTLRIGSLPKAIERVISPGAACPVFGGVLSTHQFPRLHANVCGFLVFHVVTIGGHGKPDTVSLSLPLLVGCLEAIIAVEVSIVLVADQGGLLLTLRTHALF